MVPQRAILLFQEYDIAAGCLASCAARVMQQHQGEQSLDLAPWRHQRIEQTTEPDSFAREVRAHQVLAGCGHVAFREHEIDHREHAA